MTRVVIALVISTGLILGGCRLERSQPRIQPISVQSGGNSNQASISLTASTNCAEVGEIVTFTVRVWNERDVPLTLVGSHPFDIIVKQYGWDTSTKRQMERWSESDHYPQQLDPVLEIGEAYTYEWRWIPSPLYASRPRKEENGVEVEAIVVAQRADVTQENGAGFYMGVGTMPLSAPNSYIHCADMQH